MGFKASKSSSTRSSGRYLEFRDSKSNKFWEVDVSGNSVTVRYGRIGSSGQTSTKVFASPAAADAFARKSYEEKVRKGYRGTSRGRTRGVADTSSRVKLRDSGGWTNADRRLAGQKSIETTMRYMLEPVRLF